MPAFGVRPSRAQKRPFATTLRLSPSASANSLVPVAGTATLRRFVRLGGSCGVRAGGDGAFVDVGPPIKAVSRFACRRSPKNHQQLRDARCTIPDLDSCLTWFLTAQFTRESFRMNNSPLPIAGTNPRPKRRMVFLSLAILTLTFRSLLLPNSSAAVGTVPGQGLDSGGDPSAQVERDWVDNRWSRTDVGPFLASNLEVSRRQVAKGLSIKIGENDEGAICFDTGQCAVRAAWLGGFLTFSPARFGLIESPRIAGENVLASPAGPAWLGANVRYTGLHLHGKRVVLEYTVDEMRVLDSPWLSGRGPVKAFARSLELGPCKLEAKLVLAAGGKDVETGSGELRARAVVGRGSGVLAVAVVGAGGSLVHENGNLTAVFSPHTTPRRVTLLYWVGEKAELAHFDELAKAPGEPEDLSALLPPGPARWLPELKTTGQRGFDTDILAVDTLTVPYENPWKALMFLAGVDFTADGAAYVCTIHGDVWRVTGIDDTLRELRWKRFATGLFQPLGLKVRDDRVFVLGRDQITRLHDLNGDGEADFYENFCNLIVTRPGHDYVTSLEKDSAGNFYYVDPRGAHRVSADGRRQETLATGFRNPNGLGASPDGKIITVAPQQGEWTPSSLLCEIKAGGYFGYGGPKITPERPLGYDAPLCWIPHSVDNSGGGQVWVPPNQWGPLAGHMLHLLWGRCGLMLVLRDEVGGVGQGAVVPLPARFLSGPNRGTFHPRDGHLYIAGSTGWQTSAVKDGALHRVRFTGKPVFLPVAWHAHSNGLSLTFAQPLDRATAEDPGSYAVHQWNYRYAAQYGSKDWSVTNPGKEGRDEVAVKSVRLLPDGKTVFLEVPGLRPVMQMEVKYNLSAADGRPHRSQLWLTLNRLDAARR